MSHLKLFHLRGYTRFPTSTFFQNSRAFIIQQGGAKLPRSGAKLALCVYNRVMNVRKSVRERIDSLDMKTGTHPSIHRAGHVASHVVSKVK